METAAAAASVVQKPPLPLPLPLPVLHQESAQSAGAAVCCCYAGNTVAMVDDDASCTRHSRRATRLMLLSCASVVAIGGEFVSRDALSESPACFTSGNEDSTCWSVGL